MTAVLGLILAAPASHSGKTVLTASLLRLLRRRGRRMAAFKVGPDYIDPVFHTVAAGRPCFSLDGWAMGRESFEAITTWLAEDADFVLGEGVMGLFDGAPDGTASTADISERTGWPVILVVDVRGQAASVAALIHGFATYRPSVRVAGLILNGVASPRHARALERAVAPIDFPLLGLVPRNAAFELPSRHLGLVQAVEHPDLDGFLDRAADLLAEHLDVNALIRLATAPDRAAAPAPPPPLLAGHCLAIAEDAAFAFVYPHLLRAWREAGVSLLPFSPLADEAPDAAAGAIFLPGGYPELHAARLAANRNFLGGLRQAAQAGTSIHGECGGYMVLGETLTDAEGVTHAMAGLLPLATSFAARRLHLGYREVTLAESGPLGGAGQRLRGHEFHYATIQREGGAEPFFHARDGLGADLGPVGLRRGSVAGSFIHLIDRI